MLRMIGYALPTSEIAAVVYLLWCCSPSLALNCDKAASDVEETLCSDVADRQSEEAMAKSYSTLIKTTKDRAFRKAIVASQRRWISARNHQSANDYESFANILMKQTKDRTKSLAEKTNGQATFIVKMQKQRMLLKGHPGEFSRFAADCFFVPPHFDGEGEYVCMPAMALQRGDRLCRTEALWASGRLGNVWTVAHVIGEQASLLASCKEGATTGSECPGKHSIASDVGWTRQQGLNTNLSRPATALDPDIDASLDPRMEACLRDATFPDARSFADVRGN